MRAQNAEPDALQGRLETEFNGACLRGGGGAAGGNNVRAAKFAELHTDQDGKPTLAEFSTDRQPDEAARWCKRRDMDHNGFAHRTK